MADGSIRCIAVDTPVPSQFSHEILNANPYAYLDDAPLEERRARAVEMRRMLPESVLEEVGKLDPAAIAQVRDEAWPDVRDADELHDVLHTLVALPEDCPGPVSILAQGALGAVTTSAIEPWHRFFEQLSFQGRAGLVSVAEGGTPSGLPAGCRRYWVAAEKARSFLLLFPNAQFEHPLPEVPGEPPSRDDAMLSLVQGWMSHLGPTSAGRISRMLGIAEMKSRRRCSAWKPAASILRGKFTDPKGAETEWCERRLLARIHRLTVATLRKQIEPVTAAQFMRWLLRWQHVAPRHAGARRARHARSAAAIAGLRNSGERLGAAGAGAARRRLRSQMARPALPDRRRRAGDGSRRIPPRSRMRPKASAA